MFTHCPKCLTSRTDDVLGAPCRSFKCDGIIKECPQYHTLVDVLPEPMTCGRRSSYEVQGQDRWEKFKSIDNRVCSHCGSLHPDDMFRVVRECADAGSGVGYHEGIRIEPSDKSYKIYVWQPGVRNAHEGAIKFYTDHFPRNADGDLQISPEHAGEYAAACAVTRVRFLRVHPPS